MSTSNGAGDDPDIKIEDEEEYVDKRVKQRILESRTRVDEREDELFNEPILNPDLEVNEVQSLLAWGNTVRQFLRNIEVLLDRLAHKDEGAEHYLREVNLGYVTLVPPDTAGYSFSKVAHDQYSDDALRREIGLSRGADLPEPKQVDFNGLESIIEHDTHVQETWVVCVDDSGPPPQHEYVQTQAVEPIPKFIYERSIRAADRFLHDAGIGVSLKAEDYYGEGGPGL